MTKVGILAILAIIALGIETIARLLLSLFIIVFCGFATYEVISNFCNQPKARVAGLN